MLSLMVRVSASVAAFRGSRCLGVVSASRHKLDRPVMPDVLKDGDNLVDVDVEELRAQAYASMRASYIVH